MIIISKAQARALDKLMDQSPASPNKLGERIPTLEALRDMGFARRLGCLSMLFPRVNTKYEITEEGRAAYPHVEYVDEPTNAAEAAAKAAAPAVAVTER